MIKHIHTDPVITHCTGEAHDPKVAGNMDHCMVCIPWWEEIPHCSQCSNNIRLKPYSIKPESKLAEVLGYERYHHSYGICPNCKSIFQVH